jgi:hypothetical protein
MPIECVTSGETSGTARMASGTPKSESHACAMTLDQPRRTCEQSVEIEFVSTVGSATAPAAAKLSLRMRRFCMSGESRQSGTVAASAQSTVERPANGPSTAHRRT